MIPRLRAGEVLDTTQGTLTESKVLQLPDGTQKSPRPPLTTGTWQGLHVSIPFPSSCEKKEKPKKV